MPSERKMIAFRPDDEEARILQHFAKQHGLPMTRVIGMALRQWAKQEKVEDPQPEREQAAA